MSESDITLREMLPADSAAVERLIADPGGMMTTHFLIDAYTAITAGTEDRTVGVVAEKEGRAGLVGMSTVRFGRVQYNGQLLPAAGLDSLQVERELRGQGLGRRLVDWCVQRAREEYGETCVLYAGTSTDNHASRATLKRWGRESVEPNRVAIVPVRRRPPRTVSGVAVRQAEASEYDEFAAKQNSFYQDYNLYSPADAGTMARQAGLSPGGRRVFRFFVAVDRSGKLLAGARVWLRGLLKADKINNLPLPVRLMGRLSGLLPPNDVIRDMSVTGLWYETGRLDAARYLWEEIRWQGRDHGTTLLAAFEPRDPARNAVRLQPWHQPRPEIVFAVQGPAPIDRRRLLYNISRV